MAHSLGLQVIAEGIEDALSLAMLADLGCDTGQGYYFARPVPAREFGEWLRQAPVSQDAFWRAAA